MNKKNINEMVENVKAIFTTTDAIVSKMAAKERLSVKDIVEKVALVLTVSPKSVQHYVSDFLHDAEGGYVARGKFGGYIRGEKSISASNKTSTVAEVADNSEAEAEVEIEASDTSLN